MSSAQPSPPTCSPRLSSEHCGGSALSATALPDAAGLCFHMLTNPFSPKSLVFTSMQIPRGCTPPKSFSPRFRFEHSASSLAFPVTCRLFGLSLFSFSASHSSFSTTTRLLSQNSRGGVPPWRLTPAQHSGYWANRAGAPNHEHRGNNSGESAWPAKGLGRMGRLRQDSLHREEKARRIPRLWRDHTPARPRVLPPKSCLPDARF